MTYLLGGVDSGGKVLQIRKVWRRLYFHTAFLEDFKLFLSSLSVFHFTLDLTENICLDQLVLSFLLIWFAHPSLFIVSLCFWSTSEVGKDGVTVWFSTVNTNIRLILPDAPKNTLSIKT